jgi:hypothetical protein
MKKFAPIAAIALFAVAFTSCKKDWTCECSANGQVLGSTTIKETKKKAKDACEATASYPGITVKCEIK